MSHKKTAPPVVCLLTDFGLVDHYVGVLKAVLLSSAPEARIVDLTHNIPPQDVREAAFQLMVSYQYHPKGTLFLCVVDPGVGSDRKVLYAEAGGWRFIAPDNGLLSWVLRLEDPSRLFHLPVPPGAANVSRTFHGRDVMAPAAGRILRGEDPDDFATVTQSYQQIPFPSVKKLGSQWTGEVITIDGFGNLVTNLRAADVLPFTSKSKLWFEIAGHPITVRGLSDAYASVPVGKLLAIEGSSGFIEISIRDGSASAKTGAHVGTLIKLHFRT